jgi:hypothetical protein
MIFLLMRGRERILVRIAGSVDHLNSPLYSTKPMDFAKVDGDFWLEFVRELTNE